MSMCRGPLDFATRRDAEGRHVCYFCRPDLYPPMPEGHTLCARCGVMIETKGGPMNVNMDVCAECRVILEAGR